MKKYDLFWGDLDFLTSVMEMTGGLDIPLGLLH